MTKSVESKEVKTKSKKMTSKDMKRLGCCLLAGLLLFSTIGSIILSIM